MEADKQIREEYLKHIEGIAKERLIYIDESGIEETIAKDRAWAKRGKVIADKKSGKYYKRTNIIAGYVNNKIIAPLVFQGSCNTQMFVRWVEQSLISELKPKQVVIMDNASFHKSPRIQSLIKSVDCTLIFLPPYSPDLNPIEKFWANMKRWVKNNISNTTLDHAISNFFLSLIQVK